jgi:Leu/Phe-tRNA-protein transferase
VAGGCNIAIGAAFTFESQSTNEPDASKIGSVLNWHLANWAFRFNDGKLIGPLWRSVGFRDVPRREFHRRQSEAQQVPHRAGRWQVETDLETVSH